MVKTVWTYSEEPYELNIPHEDTFAPYKGLGKRKCQKCNKEIAGVSHALNYSWSTGRLAVWCRTEKSGESVNG